MTPRWLALRWAWALAGQGAGVWVWLVEGPERWPLALAAHVPSALGLAAPLALRGLSAMARIGAGCQAVALLLMPVLGLAVAAWMQLGVRHARRRGVVAEYHQYVGYREARQRFLAAEAERAQGRLEHSLNVLPLREVLQHGSFGEKRTAIERLARRVSGEAVALLKLALADPHPDVRTFAAGGLAHLETRATERIRAAEKLVAARPTAAEARRELGDAYFELAGLALLDPQTTRLYLQRAVQAYQVALELPLRGEATIGPACGRPDRGNPFPLRAQRDPSAGARTDLEPGAFDVQLRLGEALGRLAQWPQALRALDAAVALRPEDPRVHALRAAAHYHTGAMAAAVADGRAALERGLPEDDRYETLRWLTQA